MTDPSKPAPAPPGRRESRAVALLVPVLLLFHVAVVLATGGDRLAGVDPQYYYAILRSAVVDGDVDFRNELTRLTPHPEHLDPEVVEATGRMANRYPTGWAVVSAVLWVPLRLVDGDPRADGYELRYRTAAGLAQVLAAALGLLLAHRIVRRWVDPAPALAALGLVLVGSPLLFYATYDVYMAHAAGFFAVTAWIWATLRLAEEAEPRRRTWLLLGALGGLMVIVRYTNVVFALMLLYPLTVHRGAGPAALLRGLAVAALGAAPFLAAQMLYLDRVFGSPLAWSYGDAGFAWTSPAIVGGLLSHRHGLFFFAPVLLLACVGLGLGWRRLPPGFRVGAAASLLALGYLNTAWELWTFGHAFGARAWVEASALFALGLGLAFSLPRRPVRRGLVAAAAVASAWTVTLLVLQYRDLLADDGSTTLREIARILLPG